MGFSCDDPAELEGACQRARGEGAWLRVGYGSDWEAVPETSFLNRIISSE